MTHKKQKNLEAAPDLGNSFVYFIVSNLPAQLRVGANVCLYYMCSQTVLEVKYKGNCFQKIKSNC